MSLSRRLALLAALLAVVLVLGTTEVTLSWSANSRLGDLRRESIALAETWASLLADEAPRGEPEALRRVLAAWPNQHITASAAAVFVRQGEGLVARAVTDTGQPLAPSARDRAALDLGAMEVWRMPGPRPAWRVAVPLGRPPYGVLAVEVSTRTLETWARLERQRAYGAALVAAGLLALGVAWLTSTWVERPLHALGQAMDRARAGVEQPAPAPEHGPREFRALARRYNEMQVALAERRRESDARGAMLALEERARGLDRLALAEEMAAAFAHEVGTPLGTVKGHLQLLRDDLGRGEAPDAAQRLDTVLRQVDRLTGIVRARLEHGGWPRPALAEADLAEIARRVLAFFEPVIASSGVRAGLQVQNGPGPTHHRCRCDAGLVEQILLNLLKNAVEAMPGGGELTLRVGRGPAAIWLEVADTGPGLAPEVRSRLFQPFVTTKPGHGTGLGLAVSQRLARAMEGELDLRPSSRGTVWRLTLPAAEPGGDHGRT